MVYSPPTYTQGDAMLSTTEVMELLGITKATLFKWMESSPPKIKSRSYEFGKKKHYGFSVAEVKRVKAKMNKKYIPGKGWFRED